MLMQNRAELFRFQGTARTIEKLLRVFGQTVRYLNADRAAIAQVALLDFAADVNDAAGYPHIARDQRQRVEQLLPAAADAMELRKRGKRSKTKLTPAEAVASVTSTKPKTPRTPASQPVLAGAGAGK